MIGSYSYAGVGSRTWVDQDTLMTLIAAATKFGTIYEFITSFLVSSDNYAHFRVQRFTAVGTEDSGYTPVSTNPLAPAASLDFGVGHTVEPTYTANSILYEWVQNVRVTFRWVSINDGELITPITADNGIGIICYDSDVTPTVKGTIHYRE